MARSTREQTENVNGRLVARVELRRLGVPGEHTCRRKLGSTSSRHREACSLLQLSVASKLRDEYLLHK